MTLSKNGFPCPRKFSFQLEIYDEHSIFGHPVNHSPGTLCFPNVGLWFPTRIADPDAPSSETPASREDSQPTFFSTHTSDDGHSLSYVHMPSHSAMPVSRHDLDYSRIYLDQFNFMPHYERRHPYAPQRYRQQPHHFTGAVRRTTTDGGDVRVEGSNFFFFLCVFFVPCLALRCINLEIRMQPWAEKE
uniref:UBC core domain-containing protein n=1 Tax=Steinernema glaseri TaxID=37863 RepID=A0A1I7YR28_9BILA